MLKTQNLKLPQWEAHDPIRREDFNAAFATLDASGSVVGSYTGNGLTMADGGLHVELGFRPRFLIISKGWTGTTSVSTSTYIASEHLNSGAEGYIALTDTGFTVAVGTSTSNSVPKINATGNTYGFVAFG